VEESGHERSRWKRLLEFLRRLRRKPPSSPADPYACATAPLKRGPRGRSGAAVAEIEDDSFQSFLPRRDRRFYKSSW
jgi:hypothetical protein